MEVEPSDVSTSSGFVLSTIADSALCPIIQLINEDGAIIDPWGT